MTLELEENEIKAIIQIIEAGTFSGKSILIVSDILKKLQKNSISQMRVKDLKHGQLKPSSQASKMHKKAASDIKK